MTTYVAVYRGQTISDSRLVALSADPALVADVTTRILAERTEENSDPIVESIESGRRKALQLIKQEATSAKKLGDLFSG